MAFFILCALLVAVQAAVLPPSVDPFYQPSADFAATRPGTVLKTRSVTVTGVGNTPNDAYQLLYRTQSVNGSALAALTTVIVPKGASKDKFLSYQFPEDASYIDCAPSYSLQDGSLPINPLGSQSNTKLAVYLSQGLIVAAPDHEGPDAAFPAGRLAGFLTLDGMRAVSSWLGTSPKIVGAGYSGGSIPTAWAASLHRTYAAELPIQGWTIGGTVADLEATLKKIDRGVFAGFQPAALVGLNQPSSYRSRLQPLFSRILTPYGQLQLASASRNCIPADIVAFGGQSILDYTFQILGPAFLQNQDVQYVLGQNALGRVMSETPTAPVLLYHAQNDQLIPYAPAAALKEAWCRNGGSVHFTTYAQGGHFGTEDAGVVAAVKFANSAFAGQVPKGCSTETVTNNTIDPNALGLQSADALTAVASEALRLGNN